MAVDQFCPTVFPPAVSERFTGEQKIHSSVSCDEWVCVYPLLQDSGNNRERGGCLRASTRALTTGRQWTDISDVIEKNK